VLQNGNWATKDPFASRNLPGGGAADQLSDSAVYHHVLEDIERLLKVIPVKT